MELDGITDVGSSVAVWAPYLIPLSLALVVGGLAAGRGPDGRLRWAAAVGMGFVVGGFASMGVFMRMGAPEGTYPPMPIDWSHVVLGMIGSLMGIRTLRGVFDSTHKKKVVPRGSTRDSWRGRGDE